MTEAEIAAVAGRAESISIPRDWQELDLEEPGEAWDFARERFRREAYQHEGIAQRLRKDAADAAEQAALHEERAADYRAIIHAMDKAPLTFAAHLQSIPIGDEG